MASRRFLVVIGIIALLAAFIVVALLAYDALFNHPTAFCADSPAAAVCNKNALPYVAGLMLIGGAIAALWRQLDR